MFERFSERPRIVFFVAVWSAGKRQSPYVEPEGLLHALIREDRGQIHTVWEQVFPGTPVPARRDQTDAFFPADLADALLVELRAPAPSLRLFARRRLPAPCRIS